MEYPRRRCSTMFVAKSGFCHWLGPRKLSSVEMRQEIAILQPLRNCSFEAYEATAEESKRIALQDVSAQNFLLYLRAMTIYFLVRREFMAVFHSSIPIVPLSWPKSFVMRIEISEIKYRTMLRFIVGWSWQKLWRLLGMKIVKLGGILNMRVIIRLLTCAKTYSAPKEVKLSVKR